MPHQTTTEFTPGEDPQVTDEQVLDNCEPAPEGSSEPEPAEQPVTVDPATLAELDARLAKTTGTTAAVLRDLINALTPEGSS